MYATHQCEEVGVAVLQAGAVSLMRGVRHGFSSILSRGCTLLLYSRLLCTAAIFYIYELFNNVAHSCNNINPPTHSTHYLSLSLFRGTTFRRPAIAHNTPLRDSRSVSLSFSLCLGLYISLWYIIAATHTTRARGHLIPVLSSGVNPFSWESFPRGITPSHCFSLTLSRRRRARRQRAACTTARDGRTGTHTLAHSISRTG